MQTLLQVQVPIVLQEQTPVDSGAFLTPVTIVSQTHTMFPDMAVPAGTMIVLHTHTVSFPGYVLLAATQSQIHLAPAGRGVPQGRVKVADPSSFTSLASVFVISAGS